MKRILSQSSRNCSIMSKTRQFAFACPFVFCLTPLICLTACDETTSNVTEITGMTLVESGSVMPNCTSDNVGEMVYSVDSAAAYFCAAEKWQAMNGVKGDQGLQGEPGESCTTVATANGYDIMCGGVKKGELRNGQDGESGADGVGEPGAPGVSCTAKLLNDGKGYKIECGGDSVGVVLNGNDGVGEPGESCTAISSTNGYDIICGGVKKGELRNGQDGEPGADGKSFVDGWMIDPRDKQLYRVVTIRDQTWMAENMNYATSEGSYCYGNTDANCVKYGRLYTWSAAIGSVSIQGACPAGWHIPTKSEWTELYSAVGQEAAKLKATSGWGGNGNGVDKYGFSALPAGLHYYASNFEDIGDGTDFWTATAKDDNPSFMWTARLTSESEWCAWQSRLINDAVSVRCLRDKQ